MIAGENHGWRRHPPVNGNPKNLPRQYVYKYATGYSAASALSRSILAHGSPAVARYLDFLKSGDADYPLNLLRVAGVDMASPGPVQAGLDLFASLVERMEALL